jgi:hypothetical protein
MTGRQELVVRASGGIGPQVHDVKAPGRSGPAINTRREQSSMAD